MHNNQLINLPNAETRVCDCCGAQGTRMSFETQKFNYSVDDKTVELSTRVPVWTCQVCGEQYTDHVAEELRHAAVCKHLGRLTPAEMVKLRSSLLMTQAEWASLTGFGIASIKRWETGNLIQGASADNLMRLLKDKRNVEALKRHMTNSEADESKVSKFRTHLSAETTAHASGFQLRKTVTANRTA